MHRLICYLPLLLIYVYGIAFFTFYNLFLWEHGKLQGQIRTEHSLCNIKHMNVTLQSSSDLIFPGSARV
jgi:hypothetical protein